MSNSLRGFWNPPEGVESTLARGRQKVKFAQMRNSGELKFILCPTCEDIVYSDGKTMYTIEGKAHKHTRRTK